MKSDTKNLAVIIAIATALVVVGLLFLSFGVLSPLKQQPPTVQEAPPSSEEEQELKTLDIESPDRDFSDIEKDLEDL